MARPSSAPSTGSSDFNALHSGWHNNEVQLYAFDMLAGDGDDLRQLPLSMHKSNLARLLARRTASMNRERCVSMDNRFV
jgi:ATP-dependent DNA ligase